MLSGVFPLLAVAAALLTGVSPARYLPTWESLDARPTPAWYDEAKIGIFLHWGLYSVPSFGEAWFWQLWREGDPAVSEFMRRNYRPGFKYADFAPLFTAELWDPAQWAELFAAAGAKYVVLTTKHHEGYTLWPSPLAPGWNSVDTGPGRDLVGELSEAVHDVGLKFGVYHSLFEYFHPAWLSDRESNFTRRAFAANKTMPELRALVERYRPDLVWADGQDGKINSGGPGTDYWGSKEFLAWLYSDSPVKDLVVANDRWGHDAQCHHGDYVTCSNRYNPGTLQPRKWENAMTVDLGSWGYRRNSALKDIIPIEELLRTLAETVSCGGNLLVNVGPTADGRIVLVFEERLRQLGEWLRVHGEAVYGSRPWQAQNDSATPGVWYTARGDQVYATVLQWPAGGRLRLGSLRLRPDGGRLTLLGHGDRLLAWTQTAGEGVTLQLPPLEEVTTRWAWVIRAENVAETGQEGGETGQEGGGKVKLTPKGEL